MTANLIEEEMKYLECRFPRLFEDDLTGWEMIAWFIFGITGGTIEVYILTHFTPSELWAMITSFF